MRPLLVIDDDVELLELLNEYLSSEGFTVETTDAPANGIKLAISGKYDLVILDVMMPEIDGFEALKRIRAESSIPVLMLTAKGDDIDRIIGLEMGADDYLPKPFNPRELAARIKAIQRRAGEEKKLENGNSSIALFGDLTINRKTMIVTQNGSPIDLTNVEYSILKILLNHAGETVSRDDLAEQALDRKLSLFDRSIDVHIANLRKKIGHLYQGTERIKTIRGVGYLYTAW